MSENKEDGGPRIHVDDDWKAEAARDKAKLAEESKDTGPNGPLPDPHFAEIINMIAMQAVMGLGGLAGHDGKPIPPDLGLAKHHIDMLELLGRKTEGNLEAQEKQLLDALLHDLRMQFVQMASPPDVAPDARPVQ